MQMAKKKKNICIFMGLTDVCGYYTNLKKGFDEIGIQSSLADLGFMGSQFEYSKDVPSNIWVKVWKYASWQRMKTSRVNVVGKVIWIIVQNAAFIGLFFWAVLRHDTFIFSLATTFFSFLEFPILKLLNKKIICVFHGGDSRAPYQNGKLSDLSGPSLVKLTRKKKMLMTKIRRYADFIIDNPPASYLHDGPIIIFQKLGIPFSAKIRGNSILSNNNEIRIVHAPTHIEMKGTPIIRRVISKMKTKGYPIHYIEIYDRPNQEVLEELSKCDFVINEIYSDVIMSGLTVEAAFFEKPTIVGGYVDEEVRKITSDEEFPPCYFCLPEQLEQAVEKLILDKEYRIGLGKRAKEFLNNKWTPPKVAHRYLQLINGTYPKEWLYDPKDIRYFYGFGPASLIKELIKRTIESGGVKALQISDKPELESMLVQFARSI